MKRMVGAGLIAVAPAYGQCNAQAELENYRTTQRIANESLKTPDTLATGDEGFDQIRTPCLQDDGLRVPARVFDGGRKDIEDIAAI